ncbi:hypothetical protein CEP52_000691 [Fusarium oligoseptatum]|uniref:Uncharacterized protein n=1 Tax=Fusarium oligoseptatum TaxID=2604345 RepID=A0A428UN52_9HYPO|nr:hypothetical protein CEP52_000691 [Fusarium oligoseptatum]
MTTPSYRLLPLQPHLQALQQDATTEVLTLFPVEKRKGLMSYGLPESCGKLCEALLQNVASDLESWAMTFGMAVKDLQRPEISPQAFRLEKGQHLFSTQGLHGDSRGPRKHKKETWDPAFALHVHETGLRAIVGNLRFLYIPLHLEPISCL